MARPHINEDTEIGNSEITLKNLYNRMENIESCIHCVLSQHTTLSNSAYGGVQIPLSYTRWSKGVVFTLRDGKIYCNYSGLIRVSFNALVSYEEGYILFGGVNGGYKTAAGPSNPTTLAGSSISGDIIMEVHSGDWLTFSFGLHRAFSDLVVYADTIFTAQVIALY